MDIQTLEIVQTANKLVDTLGTRDPHRIARELGIEVVPVDFKRQRGAYKVLMRNRFIFIKNDLHPVMEGIVNPKQQYRSVIDNHTHHCHWVRQR